jgi:hypothetical protein
MCFHHYRKEVVGDGQVFYVPETLGYVAETPDDDRLDSQDSCFDSQDPLPFDTLTEESQEYEGVGDFFKSVTQERKKAQKRGLADN